MLQFKGILGFGGVIAFSVLLVAVFAPLLNATTSNGTAETFDVSGYVVVEARHADGVLFYHDEDHNLIVDEGLVFIKDQIGSTSPATNGANFVALSNDGSAPTAGETTCDTEITANGFARSQGAYATPSTATYTITEVFTATGTQSVQKACLFTDVTVGEPDTLLAMNTFTSASLVSGDTLTVTWTVTLS